MRDVELAIENMRKSGQAKAAKKAGRVTAEGLILLVQLSKKPILKLTVTDFVSRDESFVRF